MSMFGNAKKIEFCMCNYSILEQIII